MLKKLCLGVFAVTLLAFQASASFVGTYKGNSIQEGSNSASIPFKLVFTKQGKLTISQTVSGVQTTTIYQVYTTDAFQAEQIVNGETVSLGQGAFKATANSLRFKGAFSSSSGIQSFTATFRFIGKKISGMISSSSGKESFTGRKVK